jgi:hypothetical protein
MVSAPSAAGIVTFTSRGPHVGADLEQPCAEGHLAAGSDGPATERILMRLGRQASGQQSPRRMNSLDCITSAKSPVRLFSVFGA